MYTMPPLLTEEQRQVLHGAADRVPITVLDPTTNLSYVLVREDLYNRFKSLFEEDPITSNERLFHLQQCGRRAGWEDPEMDVYDDLDPRRPS